MLSEGEERVRDKRPQEKGFMLFRWENKTTFRGRRRDLISKRKKKRKLAKES